jgi:hypothetical protein
LHWALAIPGWLRLCCRCCGLCCCRCCCRCCGLCCCCVRHRGCRFLPAPSKPSEPEKSLLCPCALCGRMLILQAEGKAGSQGSLCSCCLLDIVACRGLIPEIPVFVADLSLASRLPWPTGAAMPLFPLLAISPYPHPLLVRVCALVLQTASSCAATRTTARAAARSAGRLAEV